MNVQAGGENTSEVQSLLNAAVAGDEGCLADLFSIYSNRLAQLIALRIDRRIVRRVGVDDVLQEVHMHAAQQLAAYVQLPDVPFYLWLRGIAINVLSEQHRRHLGTHKRDVRVEVPIYSCSSPGDSTCTVAWLQLTASGTSPSNTLMAMEWRLRLQTIIESLPAHDREVLALRHFEQLNPAETANVLNISEKAAAMRYMRALRKLRQLLQEMSGGLSQWRL